MAGTVLLKHIWLVDLIYRSEPKGITLKEIKEKWKENDLSGGEELSRKTFNNWKVAVEEIFDILIDCDIRNGYRYHISLGEEIEKMGLRSWLLNTFSVANLMHECGGIRKRILFEQIPSGQRYLSPIIEAMKSDRLIEVDYQSYTGDAHTLTLEPYCVKVFKQRWYLLAHVPESNQLRIYALDRMHGLTLTEQTFHIPADFDAEAYFSNFFGVIVGAGGSVQQIRIKATSRESKYLDALPLHHTQCVVERTDSYTIYEYRMVVTYDFIQELLSMASAIEVLSPQNLVNEIADQIELMRRSYKK